MGRDRFDEPPELEGGAPTQPASVERGSATPSRA
jgi:hypothetical protein